jgi:ParB-like chromosome segregation protein Spo0J
MRVRVIVAEYSDEQLRRKSHLENGGTLANYDRSHYDRIKLGENKNDTNNTNNN